MKYADGSEAQSGGAMIATDCLEPATSMQLETSVGSVYNSSEEGEDTHWSGDIWEEAWPGPICGGSFFEANVLDALPLGM